MYALTPIYNYETLLCYYLLKRVHFLPQRGAGLAGRPDQRDGRPAPTERRAENAAAPVCQLQGTHNNLRPLLLKDLCFCVSLSKKGETNRSLCPSVRSS